MSLLLHLIVHNAQRLPDGKESKMLLFYDQKDIDTLVDKEHALHEAAPSIPFAVFFKPGACRPHLVS